MSVNWMSDEFKMLWTAAGRSDVSHFQIRTSNGAEGEFNVTKNGVADGKSIADAVTVLRKQIGMPGDTESIQQSKFMSRVLKIAHIESGNTNMRLPKRVPVFITPMRERVDELLDLSHAVRLVRHSQLVQDVAGAAMRTCRHRCHCFQCHSRG